MQHNQAWQFNIFLNNEIKCITEYITTNKNEHIPKKKIQPV